MYYMYTYLSLYLYIYIYIYICTHIHVKYQLLCVEGPRITAIMLIQFSLVRTRVATFAAKIVAE